MLVFVEVVATGGPMTSTRADALLATATAAGYSPGQVAFLTAYLDRAGAALRRTLRSLAWGSLAWLASEPEHVIVLHDGVKSPLKLSRLLRR
jgi:BsuBI/PstI restriction endonuclease